jgi:hypothetical protein
MTTKTSQLIPVSNFEVRMLKIGSVIEIKSGSQKGVWQITHQTGFGSDGSRARFVKLGKRGNPIRTPGNSINLSVEQIAEVLSR